MKVQDPTIVITVTAETRIALDQLLTQFAELTDLAVKTELLEWSWNFEEEKS